MRYLLLLSVLFFGACGGGECAGPPCEDPPDEHSYLGITLRFEPAEWFPPGNSFLKENNPDAFYRRLWRVGPGQPGTSKGLWIQTKFTSPLSLRPKEKEAYDHIDFIFCLKCKEAGLQ